MPQVIILIVRSEFKLVLPPFQYC